MLVRDHWSIENNVYNSLDLQWREDSAPWCTKGQAIWALGLLRVVGYNVAQLLRCKSLCPKDQPRPEEVVAKGVRHDVD